MFNGYMYEVILDVKEMPTSEFIVLKGCYWNNYGVFPS